MEPPPVLRNPGQFDHAEYLARHGVTAIIRKAQLTPWDGGSVPRSVRLQRAAATARSTIVGKLRASLRGPNVELYTSLIAGIVYGAQVAPVPEATAELFRRTGTIHLLVVSGAQVTFLAGFVLLQQHDRQTQLKVHSLTGPYIENHALPAKTR